MFSFTDGIQTDVCSSNYVTKYFLCLESLPSQETVFNLNKNFSSYAKVEVEISNLLSLLSSSNVINNKRGRSHLLKHFSQDN